MLLGSENISQPDPHHGATMQFRLREIRAPGSINPFDNFAVNSVGLLIVTAIFKAKANDAHHNGRR